MRTKKFKMPECIKHQETKDMINSLLRKMESNGAPACESDYPQLHRMATSYDLYLTCTDVISEKGPTMTNLKGEVVKRPEANLMKENWSQFLELAKEYGLTAKSGKALKIGDEDRDDSPLDRFLSGKKEVR